MRSEGHDCQRHPQAERQRRNADMQACMFPPKRLKPSPSAQGVQRACTHASAAATPRPCASTCAGRTDESPRWTHKPSRATNNTLFTDSIMFFISFFRFQRPRSSRRCAAVAIPPATIVTTAQNPAATRSSAVVAFHDHHDAVSACAGAGHPEESDGNGGPLQPHALRRQFVREGAPTEQCRAAVDPTHAMCVLLVGIPQDSQAAR